MVCPKCLKEVPMHRAHYCVRVTITTPEYEVTPERLVELLHDARSKTKEANRRDFESSAKLATLAAECDELRKDKERNLESDSIVASCDCQVKTNEIAYHKPGCKYRLICERDNALALIIGLQTDLSEIQRIAAFDLSDMVADRIFQYCKKPLAAIDAARATPPGGAGENAGARGEET